jgi:hypothetical protein
MYETASPYNDVMGFTDATKHPDYAELGEGETGALYVKVGYPLPTNFAMGKTHIYTIYLGTPSASGGNLVEETFIDKDGGATDLPVIDPKTREDKEIPEPIVDLDQPVDLILTVGGWSNASGIAIGN